jgi:hypothetical protein
MCLQRPFCFAAQEVNRLRQVRVSPEVKQIVFEQYLFDTFQIVNTFLVLFLCTRTLAMRDATAANLTNRTTTSVTSLAI